MQGQRRAGRPSPLALAALCAGLMIAEQVAGKALRDSLFLSNLSVKDLPKVMLTAALIGVPVVLATAAGMARFGPGRLIPALLVVSSALHGLEWWFLELWPREMAVLVYLHVSVLGAITISGLWSIVNERFDPHGARRAIGIISGCAGAGGLVGGLIAARVGSSLGFQALLAVLIGGALLCALGTFRLGAAPRGAASPPRSIDRAALRSLGGSPYLRSLGLLVVVTGFSGALVDYAFKAAAPRTFHSGPELVRFFTAFYVATSVATVVFQLTVSRQMLDRIGLGGALAALPLAILGFGAVAVVAPTLFTLAALSGAEATLQNSLFRSSYELLYTPLPPSEKRSAKTLIDVACDRFGEAVASGLVLGLLALSPRFVSSMGISIAVIGAGLCLWLSMRLQSSYVSELARSLRNGSVQLDPGGVSDLTTRLTLSQTLTEFDRAELLRQVAEFRARGAPAGAAPAPGAPFAPAIELTSGDAARIRAALTEQPLDPRFSSLVIPLLEIDEVAPAAVTSLQTVGPRISGQLVDALLDQELALKIRRRIPRVLRACHVPRAARGLAEALSDPDFEVRYRSALALHELLDQDEKLRTAPRIVFEAARREIERGESGQSARPFSASDPAPRPHSGFVTLADRRLEHVFTLLGLALDREALALAQQALGRNDEKLRGTALEYLENVVPERVRSVLFPYLEERPRPRPEDGAPPSRRPTPEIIDELKRSVG